jgi:hypothetical protein
MIQDRYDVRTVQEHLGRKDVKTTMIDTHVLNRAVSGCEGSRCALEIDSHGLSGCYVASVAA